MEIATRAVYDVREIQFGRRSSKIFSELITIRGVPKTSMSIGVSERNNRRNGRQTAMQNMHFSRFQTLQLQSGVGRRRHGRRAERRGSMTTMSHTFWLRTIIIVIIIVKYFSAALSSYGERFAECGTLPRWQWTAL